MFLLKAKYEQIDEVFLSKLKCGVLCINDTFGLSYLLTSVTVV